MSNEIFVVGTLTINGKGYEFILTMTKMRGLTMRVTHHLHTILSLTLMEQ